MSTEIKNHLPLKQLKLVKRTQNQRNTKQNGRANTPKVMKSLTPIKMTDEPVYKFDKYLANKTDALYPFFYSQFETESNADKIDFTEDISFYKNMTKKYSKPFNKRYVASARSSNVFNQKKSDPVLGCFVHDKQDHSLRFGDFVICADQMGACNTVYNPVVQEEMENIDESLYASDEAEMSRLDDSETSDDDEEDYDDAEEGLTNQNDSSLSADEYESFILSSPIKATSPLKHDLLLRNLQKGNSPTKNLNNERFGLFNNLQQSFEPRLRTSKYSTYDNSMTISAKGIMKMVDDSLVSSDTELYNISHSFIKRDKSGLNTNPVINADDLINALDDAFERPC